MFKFKSLKARFITSVIAIAIAMFLLLLGFTYFVLGNLLTSNTLEKFSETTGRQADQLESWFSDLHLYIETSIGFLDMLDTNEEIQRLFVRSSDLEQQIRTYGIAQDASSP